MSGYSPLKITGMESGLVKERENFLLPDDAYPDLKNMYVWREKLRRKQGTQLLGRLTRVFAVGQSLGNTIVTGVQFNFFTQINLTGAITNITNASPAVVTTATPHMLFTGQFVTISGVAGMTQINGMSYRIGVTGANTFRLFLDAAGSLPLNTNVPIFGVYAGGGTWVTNNTNAAETNKAIVPGTLVIVMPGPIQFNDQGNGTLTSATPGNSGVVNYSTGNVTLTTTAAAGVSFAVFNYYPNIPVMGIRLEELQNSTNDRTIFFDQVYAYVFDQTLNSFKEFIPGTTWNAHNGLADAVDFFWSTNYWVSQAFIPGTTPANTFPLFTTSNQKLFWETNNTGQFGAVADPPRITDGITWINWYTQSGATFTPQPWINIDVSTYLVNWLAMLPFRGRMLTFNTWEGPDAAGAIQYSNRIRWSTIGNPFIAFSNAAPPAGPTGSWRSDVRGQGGYLDIPTSEDIVAIGFVRDNLVIYCERSTWQLRYTGRSISPFQIERVNSELGAEGTFSAVQFDTSLVGIGDKGIVECDSYKSERIDIKIPDLVIMDITNLNNGPKRVQGIRDFIKRLAYWTLPLDNQYDPNVPTASQLYPNARLVYNYENDSWSLFTDCFTALGTYQPQEGRTWLNTKLPWIKAKFSWKSTQAVGIPSILGGNQQGFVHYLSRDEVTVNDPILYISAITAFGAGAATVITVPNHNLLTTTGNTSTSNVPYVIQISGIPTGTSFDNLNGGIFGISVINANDLALYTYNADTDEFSDEQTDTIPLIPYVGGGIINIRDNISIVSKKFNFLDEGQNIQLGYIDILMNATGSNNPGAITLKVFLDYNEEQASNTPPQNEIADYSVVANPDTFFNSVIPTSQATLNNVGGTKFWQRVMCPTRANFLTLQYTLSNAQLAGEEQTKDVQIDAQVLWIRKAGRMTSI